MRECNKCGEEKEISDFRKGSKYTGGYRPTCIKCINDNQNKKYREKHGTTKSKRHRGFFKDSLERRLFYKYGLMYKDVFELFKEQHGTCKICGCLPTSSRNSGHTHFAVDHCHRTGELRGLLCMSCNVALGMMEDNPKYLLSCVEYLY